MYNSDLTYRGGPHATPRRFQRLSLLQMRLRKYILTPTRSLTTTIIMDLCSAFQEYEDHILWGPLIQRQIPLHQCSPNYFLLGQRRILPRSCSHFRPAHLLLLVESQWHFKLNSYASWSGQTVVPNCLWRSLVYLNYHQEFAGIPWDSRVQDTPKRQHYCPSWLITCTKQSNTAAAAPRSASLKRKGHRTFLCNWASKRIAMHVLGPVLKMRTGNQLFIVIRHRYMKETESMPSLKTTALRVASIVLNHWIDSKGTLAFGLTDNDLLFVSRFIEKLCTFLGVNLVLNTAFQSQNRCPTKGLKKFIVAWLRHFATEDQADLDLIVQSFS